MVGEDCIAKASTQQHSVCVAVGPLPDHFQPQTKHHWPTIPSDGRSHQQPNGAPSATHTLCLCLCHESHSNTLIMPKQAFFPGSAGDQTRPLSNLSSIPLPVPLPTFLVKYKWCFRKCKTCTFFQGRAQIISLPAVHF